MERVTLLDTAVGSTNKGDDIIMSCFYEEMKELLELYFVLNAPTHLRSTSFFQNIGKLPDSANEIYNSKYKFVCGTNILSSNLFGRSNQWDISLSTCKPFEGAVLVGVGGTLNISKGIKGMYTKKVYNKVLSRDFIHSTRTEDAKIGLEKLGFQAVNTGCLTLWKMTPEFCLGIPKDKAKDVVLTLTDYNKNSELDKLIISIVKKNYENVYFWPQGIYDDEYIKFLNKDNDIEVLPPTVKAYEALLNSNDDIDYVGTRFHGGIFSMRHSKRCIIITLDNRMSAMQSRVLNNCISRNDVKSQLEKKINSSFETRVDIDVDLINEWKGQFC